MRRARVWIPVLLALGLAGEIAFGFARFADAVPRAPNRAAADVEAVVVLTGGSGRLEAGLEILAATPGARMFVSGVYPGADLGQILAASGADAGFARGRIDIGHAADTRGNARETARWMAREGLTRAALITAAYHMPRAEAEFRRAMPDAELALYPVFPPHVRLDAWWRHGGAARLLVEEYVKLRLARLRP